MIEGKDFDLLSVHQEPGVIFAHLETTPVDPMQFPDVWNYVEIIFTRYIFRKGYLLHLYLLACPWLCRINCSTQLISTVHAPP